MVWDSTLFLGGRIKVYISTQHPVSVGARTHFCLHMNRFKFCFYTNCVWWGQTLVPHSAIIPTLAQWPRLNPGFDPPPNLSLQALGWGWVLYSACQLDSACFTPSSLVCLLPCSPPSPIPPPPTPHRGAGNWIQLERCLIQKWVELGPLMPVMVKDYINGSLCRHYIDVNGVAARLPGRDKGYISRLSCSLSDLSLYSEHARHTHTFIRMEDRTCVACLSETAASPGNRVMYILWF